MQTKVCKIRTAVVSVRSLMPDPDPEPERPIWMDPGRNWHWETMTKTWLPSLEEDWDGDDSDCSGGNEVQGGVHGSQDPAASAQGMGAVAPGGAE